MANRYRLQMGATNMPGLPQDRLSMNTYTSQRYQAPESGFKQVFRKAADWFSSLSTIATVVGFFYPPVAAVAAIASQAAPAVDMISAGMNNGQPQMATMQTSSRYMPNWR
ncbi:MAG: hypothetical protein H7338_05165 [Candidatus Sericytochromatia bacterium]|nr:hypothetical protein [Candidatus Sericytochromatia bacterium]